MAVTVPVLTQFQTQSGNVPVSQLDTNLTNLRNAMHGIAALLTDIQAGYAVRNLIGNNNSVTPNTKYDLSADLVALFNPTSKATEVVVRNTGVLTNDTGLASAANGRDQVAAFAASTFLHFYFIWNGTAIATLSSLAVPATGPTLPTGYTSWAYAGAVFYNATPLLVKTRMRGASMYYETFQSALTAGVAAVETAVILSTLVPANALSIFLSGQWDATGNQNPRLRVISGADFFRSHTSDSTTNRPVDWSIVVPNIGQQIFYLHALAPAVGFEFFIDVNGYRIANGGE